MTLASRYCLGAGKGQETKDDEQQTKQNNANEQTIQPTETFHEALGYLDVVIAFLENNLLNCGPLRPKVNDIILQSSIHEQLRKQLHSDRY